MSDQFGSNGSPDQFVADGSPDQFVAEGSPDQFGSNGSPDQFGSNGPELYQKPNTPQSDHFLNSNIPKVNIEPDE